MSGKIRAQIFKYTFLLLVCLIASFILLLNTDILHYSHPEFNTPYDHQKYIYMARNPFDLHVAPFSWRIGVPLLVFIMPLDNMVEFMFIALASIFISGVFIYLSSEAYDLHGILPWIGVVMFFSLEYVSFTLYDFWLPDAASFAVLSILVFLAITRRPRLFALVIFIGVAVKETALFAAPLYYTLNATQPLDRRLAGETVAVNLPAVMLLVAIRALIPAYNGDLVYMGTLDWRLVQWGGQGAYNYLDLVSQIVPWRISTLHSPYFVISYFVAPLGVTAVLPFLAPKKNSHLFIRLLPFILAVYSQMAVALNTERLLVLAFPASILLSLNALKHTGAWLKNHGLPDAVHRKGGTVLVAPRVNNID